MGAWHKSSWYGSAWYNSAWYGGAGGGGASTSTGGGSVVHLGPPAGWREITEKELRSSAERAHARERQKRLARLRGVRREDVAKAPEPVQRDHSRIVDSILTGHDGPIDALARLIAKLDADRERETSEARRSVVAKSKRSFARWGTRRSVVKALTLTPATGRLLTT